MNFLLLRDRYGLRGWDDGHSTITVSREGLKLFVKKALSQQPFDQDWYLNNYPDVKRAIESGAFVDAKHHYIECGYFEGRLPGLIGFDAGRYLNTYEDLKPISTLPNADKVAERHFVQYGYREGRDI
jgi:hypothetical protein